MIAGNGHVDLGVEVRNILVVRTSALGDVIHVLPALEALRQLFPDARITWLVEPLGAAILEGHPSIDKLFVIPRKEWSRKLKSPWKWPGILREIAGKIATIRRERFDLVIDFQCNIRSGLSVLLSGGKVRLGFARCDCRERLGSCFTNRKAEKAPLLRQKVLKNLHLVRALGWKGPVPEGRVAIDDSDRRWAREYVDSLSRNGPFVLVHPGVSAFGALKRWPIEYFHQFCQRLEDELDARVSLSWGPGEEEIAQSVGRGVLAPATPRLLRLAALIEASDLFVACDTGALHLAALLGTPVVGLYGPKNPLVYAPYDYRGRVVTSGVPCSPCGLRTCEHRICMSTIYADDVFEAAREVLAGERDRPMPCPPAPL